MAPDLTPDPEYVAARRVLLDTLKALDEHRGAVVVAGAQAIYLRAGAGVLPVADLTTDADLALDPALLSPAPDLEGMLKAGGFDHVEHGGAGVMGDGRGRARQTSEDPPRSDRPGRRRPGRSRGAARTSWQTGGATEPGPRGRTRRKQAHADRTHDKDASDVVRIMQSLATGPMAAALAELRTDPAAGRSTELGITYFENLFGRRNGEGIAMAIRALRLAMPEERVRAICLAYAEQLRGTLY